jgi:hypothetical protein
VSAIEILHFQWKIRLLGIVQRYFFAPVENQLDSGDADQHSGGHRELIGFPPGTVIAITPEC